MTQSTYRRYRSACPSCGADVTFSSAQSTHAICSYCSSTLARNGDVLTRVGKVAELFEDYSPFQLYTSGVWQSKTLHAYSAFIDHSSGSAGDTGAARAFTLVGRLQYEYEQACWSEWIATFNDGSRAYLSEDNGNFVFSLPLNLIQAALPPFAFFTLNRTLTVANLGTFTVSAMTVVRLRGAQGELFQVPPLDKYFNIIELRNNLNQVLSLQFTHNTFGDASNTLEEATLGEAVFLDDLKLTGLRHVSEKFEKGQSFNCPHCGGNVEIKLASTKSLSCLHCKSLIDVSSGAGAQLNSIQDEPVTPLIALGSVAKIQGKSWQVVGFQHRMAQEQYDGESEYFYWDEYLLYNPMGGFLFLVDSFEGWSMLKPLTGLPKKYAQSAQYLGKKYTLKEQYTARTTYVLGEFYWRVQRDQRTNNSDYENNNAVLSLEEGNNETVWSLGNKLTGDTVMAMLSLDKSIHGKKFSRESTGPISQSPVKIIIFIAIVLIIIILSRCDSDCDSAVENCSSGYRTSGSSWGGYGSGGGHK